MNLAFAKMVLNIKKFNHNFLSFKIRNIPNYFVVWDIFCKFAIVKLKAIEDYETNF